MPEPFDIDKYRSIGVIRPKTREANRRDRALSRDMEAYRRLRAEGRQPAGITGCAALERDATMPIELEMGRTFDKADHAHVREGMRISEELGMRGPFDR